MTSPTTPDSPVSSGNDYAATASTAYNAALDVIASVEPRVAQATRAELADQRSSLKLIASENYASPAVLLTMGTWFSDQYAEGTVGHRFYAGCQNVDTVESLAAEHARELFGVREEPWKLFSAMPHSASAMAKNEFQNPSADRSSARIPSGRPFISLQTPQR